MYEIPGTVFQLYNTFKDRMTFIEPTIFVDNSKFDEIFFFGFNNECKFKYYSVTLCIYNLTS